MSRGKCTAFFEGEITEGIGSVILFLHDIIVSNELSSSSDEPPSMKMLFFALAGDSLETSIGDVDKAFLEVTELPRERIGARCEKP